MIDGVPLTKQDATGTVSLEHIMLDQIERVEIVRGNVSAIYGSGAVGGVMKALFLLLILLGLLAVAKMLLSPP